MKLIFKLTKESKITKNPCAIDALLLMPFFLYQMTYSNNHPLVKMAALPPYVQNLLYVYTFKV